MDITKKEIRASSVTVSPLPDQTISREVLLEKYAKGTESSIDDVRARIAHALAAVEPEDKRAAVGKALPAGDGSRLHPRRPHHVGRRHPDAGDADQLLRAAGGRLDFRNRRQQARHLHRAAAGGRDHAPRRRRRLRLFLDPAQGLGSEGHAVARQRPGILYARVRPLLRDGGIGGLAPRRANGRAALRPSRHRGIHPCQGPRRPVQLQHLGRRHRCLHAGGGERPRSRTRAQGAAAQGVDGRRRLSARRRAVGLPQAARARAVGPDHALDLRPRRAGHPVPRPHEPRQQPQLLRDHRGHQSLRRAAAAALRLLLPGLDQPDQLRHRPVHRGSRVRFRALRRDGRDFGAHARQRARRHRLAAAAAARRGDEQAPRRPGLHRPGRRADHAVPALRQRRRARDSRRRSPK